MPYTVIEAVQTQLELYPESNLKDIYKSFFQDEFGPGHILVNHEKAENYFKQELGSMKGRGRYNIEPCGRGRNFCRVPMDLVLDGYIHEDDYFSAFITGASGYILPDVELWKQKWNIILGILNKQFGVIKNFENDSAKIFEVLGQGNYVMYHSSCYRNEYDPHYRIFSVRSITSSFNSKVEL